MHSPRFDDLFAPAERRPPVHVLGEVTATSPFTVQVEGTATADAVEGFLVLSTYTPAIGDTVLLLRAGPTYVAIGAL